MDFQHNLNYNLDFGKNSWIVYLSRYQLSFWAVRFNCILKWFLLFQVFIDSTAVWTPKPARNQHSGLPVTAAKADATSFLCLCIPFCDRVSGKVSHFFCIPCGDWHGVSACTGDIKCLAASLIFMLSRSKQEWLLMKERMNLSMAFAL
jgi:hypothetical protein